MVRFGRVKKKTKAEPVVIPTTTTTAAVRSQESVVENPNADSDFFVSSPVSPVPIPVPVPDTPPAPVPEPVPRVSLPHVDTQLNMHQYNGLFEMGSSPDGQHGSSVANDSSTDQTLPLSPNPTNGDASSTSEWSSAVGHAATGKSGRVIHTLQEDIARLTRECSVYRSRAEETQRTNEAFKTQVQNMGERLRNLELANETNLHSISRKDQKMKELRAEIQSEKDRRQHAEGAANQTSLLMTQARDDYNRRSAELQEIANHSQTQYDVLVKSRQREKAEQEKRFKAIRDEFLALKAEHEKKHVELERLDTIMAQKNREIETSRENFGRLFEDYEAYKTAHDEDVRGLIDRGHQGEGKIDAALASLKETEGRMKWVIQISESSDSKDETP